MLRLPRHQVDKETYEKESGIVKRLFYEEGKTGAQIAKLFGVSIGWVNARLHEEYKPRVIDKEAYAKTENRVIDELAEWLFQTKGARVQKQFTMYYDPFRFEVDLVAIVNGEKWIIEVKPPNSHKYQSWLKFTLGDLLLLQVFYKKNVYLCITRADYAKPGVKDCCNFLKVGMILYDTIEKPNFEVLDNFPVV